MIDPARSNAVDLATAIRRRKISSREALDALLSRTEAVNPPLNAIVTIDAERARREADEADAALARGEVRGPLHGVPMTVKDTFETAGMRTTSGSPTLSDYVPDADAVTVARLRAAGAVIFGKTNTSEFAGDAQTYNPLFGTTNNPWDRERSPGGSSGGSAAALAAGLTPLELGSDIGGSIRGPSHCCGIYGHKPTWGIVPARGHIPGPPGTLSETDLNVVGPLARSAEDLAAAMDLLAGPDEARGVAWSLRLPPPRGRRLRDLRTAAWLDDPVCPVGSDVREVFEGGVGRLRAAGVEVDDRARPVDDLAAVNRVYQQLLWPIVATSAPSEQVAQLFEAARLVPADDESIGARLARDVALSHMDWLALDEKRHRFRAQWARFFRDFDVLLCPIWPTPAIRHDPSDPPLDRTVPIDGTDRPYSDLVTWAGLVTMAWLPSTLAPVGRTAAGLPVGWQIVGPWLEDRTPLAFAAWTADVVGTFEPPP